MLIGNKIYARLALCCLTIMLLVACTTRRNTALSRAYQSTNTRYNVHFNAQVAFNEAMLQKEEAHKEEFSKMLSVYFEEQDTTKVVRFTGFERAIDKTTKAIMQHSIKLRPKRDRNKMHDPEYKAWVSQREFNPFLKNSWMLLGKSEFHNGGYLRAVSTFMYTSRIYASQKEIVTECQLWIARCYIAMGWIYEAENILRHLERDKAITKRLEPMHAALRAHYHVENKEYAEAINYLSKAIDTEKNASQCTRLRYLLGQLYERLGDKNKAYEAFKSVKGLGTSHMFNFNADLHQIALVNLSLKETEKSYLSLASKSRNKEYLDQIYYHLGSSYLNEKDSTNAIKYFRKAVEESTRNGYDMALSAIELGDLYFNKREFPNAQPFYAGALPKLTEKDDSYQRVNKRAEVLDGLVLHINEIHKQDSLLHLASLPEDERETIIYAKIAQLKKEEEDKKKREEQAERSQQMESQQQTGWDDLTSMNRPIQRPVQSQSNQDANKFYFYNPSLVEQGRIAFQKKWGRLPLEDNWRRTDKSSSLFANLADFDTDSIASIDGDLADDQSGKVLDDKYNVDYYLQQLPLTDEAKEASNKIIESALFKLGFMYKEMLEDLDLSADAFQQSLERYPSGENVEEIYYQLFLINMQERNGQMMEVYRQRILAYFPEGKYAVPLSQTNYEQNYRQMAVMQDALYEDTYSAYGRGDTDKVRANSDEISKKYPFGPLMSKFSLLDALSYAQTRDINALETKLTELLTKYPNADEASLARGILERIKDGHILLSDGSLLQSVNWDNAYKQAADSADMEQKFTLYSASLDSEYLLLLTFPTGSVDRNDLLYKVADYNFSNYLVQVYDLGYERRESRDIIEIKGFRNFDAVKSYIESASEGADGLLNNLNPMVTIVPISVENYPSNFEKLGLLNYQSFGSQFFGDQMPFLMSKWEKDTHLPRQEQIVVLPKETEEPKEELITLVGKDKDLLEDDSQKVKDIDIESILAKTDPQYKDAKDQKELNLEHLLNENQVDIVGSVITGIENVYDNPVEGLKSIIQSFSTKKNLTEAEKEDRKRFKEEEKRLLAKQKAHLDSIGAVEKAFQDSIQNMEKLKLQKEKDQAQTRKDEVKAKVKEQEAEQKAREERRKEQMQEREERRKQQERDREDLRKTQEAERKTVLQEREQRRKQMLEEREKARKEREKELEQRRK